MSVVLASSQPPTPVIAGFPKKGIDDRFSGRSSFAWAMDQLAASSLCPPAMPELDDNVLSLRPPRNTPE